MKTKNVLNCIAQRKIQVVEYATSAVFNWLENTNRSVVTVVKSVQVKMGLYTFAFY